MKMSETEFKCITVPYIYHTELEDSLKSKIKEYEKNGLIFHSLSVIREYENPLEEYGRVCVFMVSFKESVSRKRTTVKR